MTQKDGMGREEGSGWGTRVYMWWIHVDIWQNQYNIVKLKNKIKYLKKKKRCLLLRRKAMTNLDSELKTETSLCQGRSVCRSRSNGQNWT